MAQIIRRLIETVRNIFYTHKHHAVYDDEFCQWYCRKCNHQLHEDDFPPRIWKYLERKTKKKLRRY